MRTVGSLEVLKLGEQAPGVTESNVGNGASENGVPTSNPAVAHCAPAAPQLMPNENLSVSPNGCWSSNALM